MVKAGQWGTTIAGADLTDPDRPSWTELIAKLGRSKKMILGLPARVIARSSFHAARDPVACRGGEGVVWLSRPKAVEWADSGELLPEKAFGRYEKAHRAVVAPKLNGYRLGAAMLLPATRAGILTRNTMARAMPPLTAVSSLRRKKVSA